MFSRLLNYIIRYSRNNTDVDALYSCALHWYVCCLLCNLHCHLLVIIRGNCKIIDSPLIMHLHILHIYPAKFCMHVISAQQANNTGNYRSTVAEHKVTSACLSVTCPAVLRAHFFIRFWWNLALSFGPWKLTWGQHLMTPSPILLTVLHPCNAFSVGWSERRRTVQ